MSETESPPRTWWPRFSLLTALLVTALVACGITIWQLWRDVGPLRAENRRMRTEVGLLTIDDPAKACAIAIDTKQYNTWKWRIYLPPEGQYMFFGYSGHLPSPNELQGMDLLEAIKKNASGFSTGGSVFQGEFIMEAWLAKKDDQWMLHTDPGGGATVRQPSGDWLTELGPFLHSGGIGHKQQVDFEAGQPILLMYLRKPVVKELPNGNTTTETAQGAADGVAVWIEQQRPASPGATP